MLQMATRHHLPHVDSSPARRSVLEKGDGSVERVDNRAQARNQVSEYPDSTSRFVVC